jgi:hypothetical protein
MDTAGKVVPVLQDVGQDLELMQAHTERDMNRAEDMLNRVCGELEKQVRRTQRCLRACTVHLRICI